MNLEQTTKKLVSITGQVERITYANNETGYAIVKVRICGYYELVTVVGNIVSPAPGAILNMSGEWSSHPKFGDQFKVVFYSCSAPASIDGIEKYLGSGLIKGIGPVMAQRIVKIFGEKTLDIIEESVEKLRQVAGIGKQRIGMISKAWIKQKEIRSVMLFLQSHDISSAYATKIYKRYGNKSIDVVTENPYCLAHDIFGIGFITADKIAQKLGFDKNFPLRAEAGILYVLHELADEGHVYCPLDLPYKPSIFETDLTCSTVDSDQYSLLSKAAEILKIEQDVLNIAIQSLNAKKKIVIEELRDDLEVVKGIFLTGYHIAEMQTAKRLMCIRDVEKNINNIDAEKELDWVQAKLSITLAKRQIEAIRAAITNKLLVITGGPGTGKTTIIKSILQIFSKQTSKILLAAPTGRAAKRMTEATGLQSKTIHRLLEFNFAKGGFQKNEENLLICDLIILDEASMIDILLIHHLLKSIPKHATLIIVGDINQLPSVGPGSVLKDIIRSKACTVVELNEIFRQAQKSSIVVNAHKIINGQYPVINNIENTDLYFIKEDKQENVLDKIIRVVKDRIPSKFKYDSVSDIQVLTPMNRGIIGTTKLNEALQDALNPHGFELIRGRQRYRVGDKVMQIRNNYDKDVFNGDTGYIKIIDVENQTVVVSIDNLDIKYEYSELDELILAYAISIHKSQGSEYPVVVIPLVAQHYVMLARNLLYTGITRGKNLVVLIGSKRAMFLAVSNNKIMNRNSWLSKRLLTK